MKNIKRILLAFVAVFAAVLLVACGAKSDNGTYVYKPSKTELKKILEEQGVSGSQLESIGDVINFEVSIKIKDSKGTLSIAGEVAGQKNKRSYEVKINQKQVKVKRLNTKFLAMYSLLIYLERKVQITQQLWKCSKTLNSSAQNNTREGQRVSALFLLYNILNQN